MSDYTVKVMKGVGFLCRSWLNMI